MMERNKISPKEIHFNIVIEQIASYIRGHHTKTLYIVHFISENKTEYWVDITGGNYHDMQKKYPYSDIKQAVAYYNSL